MISRTLLSIILTFGCHCLPAAGQAERDTKPLVLGHGKGVFNVGPLLAQDDFEDLDNWVVQIQAREGFAPPQVEVRNGTLDCLLPGRGCTIWFKKKLKTRVTITYDVLCPTPDPGIKGLEPRDINNFWLATDLGDPGDGLFDQERYTGNFGTYDKMHGYYASTGGGRNTTTRMRRYPRVVDGEPVEHLAFNDKDGKPDFLITPDKVMKVQLVAYDDVIQYILNGKLNYEIARGDRTSVEKSNDEGERFMEETVYDLDRFPIYQEGYFGFRMVGTHHIYSNFRVHALEPHAQTTVKVSSLEEFREAIAKSHQGIILEPGKYKVQDDQGFRFSGSHNDVELTGAYIEVPLEKASGKSLFLLTGDHITLRGGTLEDTYPDGMTKVTDFGRYNHDQTFGGMNEMRIRGDDNQVIGMKMTVRGSFPYGYGNMYGIGGGTVLDLRKHCGIQITGDRAIIDGCDIKMEAFGHAIYVQGGDRTTVRNTTVEGTLRPSNDCYTETDPDDLAKKFNYQLQWPELVKGLPIPRDHMINCAEDGIRAYKGAGDMIVENCVVKKMRGGIKLYMAKSARVTNCQVLDCVIQGYSLPSRGVISNSSGNAAYGPLLYIHSDKHADQRIDLKVLPAPHSLGDHPLAALKGAGHSINLSVPDEASAETLRPIIVGYPMRFDFLSVDYPNVPKGHEAHFEKFSPKTYRATRINLHNDTSHPVVLGELSDSNHIVSRGTVEDLGTSNHSSALRE